MTLKDLKIGASARVTSVGGGGALRQHFLDMGLIPGTVVTAQKLAPMGDPLQVLVQGYELTLRMADAADISVEPLEPSEAQRAQKVALEDEEAHAQSPTSPTAEPKVQHDTQGAATEKGASASANDSTLKQTSDPLSNSPEVQQAPQEAAEHVPRRDMAHPGLGEESHGTGRKTKPVLPRGAKVTFALVGNQNCGKTTLFNQLTGANQHVGNFPGVTIDQKSGSIKGHPEATVVDLPGIYSLSPYTPEEVVSRQFILEAKPTAIINIVDATNIERNLYLTMQLMELGVPMVLALNMMDELESNGGTVRVNELEELLGIPVVPISALKNEGVAELVEHALHVARYGEVPRRQDFCSPQDHGGTVHRCLHAVMHLVEDHAQAAGIPLRFAASKLVEGDQLVEKALKLSQNEHETMAHIRRELQEERGLDASAAMADMRFSYIRRACARAVVKPEESREHRRSLRMDKLLTGRWTAVPVFLLIMALIFWVTFDVLGGTLQDWLEAFVEWGTAETDALLTRWHVNDVVHSLVTGGIYAGVGTVISFIPIIVLLFFFLSLLEDSGYMARIAFVMDKPMRRLGLSGRSIVPLLMGFGCSVPSIMASRTLPSARDRRLTVTLTPFMSCTAKLPIYAFFTSAFFPRHAGLVMTGLYALGVLTGIVVALVLKRTAYRGEAVPFVMELPNYRVPGARNVLRLMWDKTRDFLQRAFTVIFLATIVIWFFQTFDFQLHTVADSADSMLAAIGGVVAPVFAPLGFGDWRFATALITGFLAKESVVGTLGVLFPGAGGVQSVLTTASACSLLVFCLLYTPCVATIATVRREINGRFAAALVVWQCLIAWVVAFLVYGVARLL